MGKGPELTFFQKDIQMANRYMKKSSKLLILREMQIGTTVTYITPVRTAVIKKTRDNQCWEICREMETLVGNVGGNVNHTVAMENSIDFPQEIKNRTTNNSTYKYTKRKRNNYLKEIMYCYVYYSFIHNSKYRTTIIHYSKYENNISVHQWMTGSRKCCIYMQWNISQL